MTTLVRKGLGIDVLWFAFVLWYSDIYDNEKRSKDEHDRVVICFRTLIFWYLWQPIAFLYGEPYRCDLLSYFDILIFMTTHYFVENTEPLLWFAFVLWYSDIYDNWSTMHYIWNWVVICFRTLIFWYLWQLSLQLIIGTISCDLLSYFDILIFMTTISI